MGSQAAAGKARKPRNRRLSEDRVKRNAEEYHQSLLGVRHAFEKVTMLELRHLTADNTNKTLLPTFADGYLLCYLANVLLRRKKLPTIKPHRPADLDYNSSKHRGLTPQQIAENFSELERVWDDIVDENVVFPTRSDF